MRRREHCAGLLLGLLLVVLGGRALAYAPRRRRSRASSAARGSP